MAKLDLLDQILFGDSAQRNVINRNADELLVVEADLDKLRTVVQRQAQEILKLRAMLMGVVEVVQEKAPFRDAELESAVQRAWESLNPATASLRGAEHPYRGPVGEEPTPEEVEAAKVLLTKAQDHHFSMRFDQARAIYHQVVERHPNTKQAINARQQLDNLKKG
ncbi:MAG: hypothetical protein SFX73_08960 [Kofleriaceae bacterium]|nr:hypothetical protein [Kofleriaceae bacterium]